MKRLTVHWPASRSNSLRRGMSSMPRPAAAKIAPNAANPGATQPRSPPMKTAAATARIISPSTRNRLANSRIPPLGRSTKHPSRGSTKVAVRKFAEAACIGDVSTSMSRLPTRTVAMGEPCCEAASGLLVLQVFVKPGDRCLLGLLGVGAFESVAGALERQQFRLDAAGLQFID